MADDPPASRWSAASTGVQSAATWLATAAGASAAAVFGAGPIFNSEVDSSEWSADRWFFVIFLAGVGAGAVIYVIGRLLALQLPIEITLDALPSALLNRIQGNELSEYLPGDAKNLADFKERLQAYSNAAIVLEAEAAAETNAAKKAELTELATIQKNNRDEYRAKRDELYELAAFELQSERLTPRASKEWMYLGGAAVVSVVAMAVFTFVTGSPAAEDGDKEGDDVATPAMGQMTPTLAGTNVWSDLGLAKCDIGGVVPVVVLGATDTDYTVQTLGTPQGCGRHELTLPRKLVKLVKVAPSLATITLSPTESPSTSG